MKVETKVGILFFIAVVLVVVFAYLLGAINPFSNHHTLYLGYNFAGGIEVGSPVRVMGIKVGKVKSISFVPEQKMPNGEEVKLKIEITISKQAWPTVRTDSKFYINLAGVIGEKFLEVTPGSLASPTFEPGMLVRGEDPPRIDQLISQSYGLAGKIIEFVDKNEGTVTEAIDSLGSLVTNFNKTLVLLDKSTKKVQMADFLENIVQISGDVAHVSKKLRSSETEKTMDLVHRLVWRLDDLDKAAIKKFLQEEGIKARMGF